MESRPYDQSYDPTFTGPFNNTFVSDPRVVAAASNKTVITGQSRFKYFRRPVMPRMNAVPPYILLGPTAAHDPLKPVEVVTEVAFKTVEVQTVYRESEAQTLPYSPDYFVPEGSDPEVLLLKNLSSQNGLPLGKSELDMIVHARRKKEIESNLPPFTDEASLALRKKLMEQQEAREFKLRENEIDAKREIRLLELQRALYERDESSSFLASQRVEAMRQMKMEERENTLQKIRNKRIKVLRRLARERNTADPLLKDGSAKKDIIDGYFDKSSQVYAPVKREGKDLKKDAAFFDIASRTAPLDSLGAILDLEEVVPSSLLSSGPTSFKPSQVMSKTAPAGIVSGGGRAAEHRLTSAAQRTLRNTKKDVEEMHQILLRKKRAAVISRTERTDQSVTGGSLALSASAPGSAAPTTGAGERERQSSSAEGTLLSRKPKGRPMTPDLTAEGTGEGPAPGPEMDDSLASACILLQRLLRGRAIQNIMFEGRARRRELIAELRSADESAPSEQLNLVEEDIERNERRKERMRSSTVDAVAGTVASHVLSKMATDMVLISEVSRLQAMAAEFVESRRRLEAFEAGRRQRENMEVAREEDEEGEG